MELPTDSFASPRNILRMLFRQRAVILLCFAAVMAATAAVTFLGPKTYRSEAKLFVGLGAEDVIVDSPRILGENVVTVQPAHEEEIGTVVELLRSRVLAERVVAALGVPVVLGTGALPTEPLASAADAVPLPPSGDYARAVRAVLEDLKVEALSKSNVVRVSYQANNPGVAQAIVRKWIEAFQEENARLNRSPEGYQLLAKQTDRARADLDALEGRAQELKAESGVYSPQTQTDLLVQRVSKFEEELLATEAAIAAAEAEVARLREAAGAAPKTQVTSRQGVANPVVDNLKAQLHNLLIQQEDLLRKHPEGHPDVLMARRQVELVGQLLEQQQADREELTVAPGRVYEEAQLALLKQEPALTALRAKAESLQAQIGAERRRLREAESHARRLRELGRDIAVQEGHYKRYADNLEQAQINQTVREEKISKIRLAQPASYEVTPTYPKKVINFGIGFVLAVFCGLGLALVRERMDDTFREGRDVQGRLGVPAAVAVPRLNSGERDAPRPVALAYLRMLDGLPWPRPAGGPAPLVGVTAVRPGAGATTAAAQLAEAAAGVTGARVLLVDANPADPALSALYGAAAAPGWGDALAGAAAAPRAVPGLPNLSLLPAGRTAGPPDQPAAELGGLLRGLADRFDLVVVDLPPTGAPLTRHLAGRLDAAVLVVEADRDRPDAVLPEKELLARGGARWAGAVLNKVRRHLPPWVERLT